MVFKSLSAHLTGVLLFVDYHDGVLLSLPLRLSQSLLHLCPLGSDHLESLLLGLRHCLLDLIHGLTLHLVHGLLCRFGGGQMSVSFLLTLRAAIVTEHHVGRSPYRLFSRSRP